MSNREPVYKSNRRLGANLWGRPKSPVNKRNYPNGVHGPQKLNAKLSDFGTQLKAKQKLKLFYGNMTETQFRRYYQEAVRRKGDTGENLIALLESRLGSILFHACFSPTPHAARQLINHKHVSVNGRVVNIASQQVSVGDVIQIRTAKGQRIVKDFAELKERDVPDYLEVDEKHCTITIKRIPTFAEVPYPVEMEPALVIEYYSR